MIYLTVNYGLLRNHYWRLDDLGFYKSQTSNPIPHQSSATFAPPPQKKKKNLKIVKFKGILDI